jgi:alpha-beta hydrolase superfamily lysophospholipase
MLREQCEPDTKFVLVGHSVGSFICTEVLKARPNHNITRLFALFPTLQHIAKTPNGVALSVSIFNNGIERDISLNFSDSRYFQLSLGA